ncbi:UDP-N-acetylmuramate dehydrogenase [Clostridium oryzae]|uniref:UDP-N-acetylenolpyruvoylglucosamine reductase n=1 Tax=Clostridium oryzae TaxID=1450648 RepID=A0A1V4IKM1_9CLOT|nr:UDP-N-acetylmuramate dehydrogenase [Clostridium oryzae]OPJ60409.1 UDP-N-acetylenolpyruvoylglucosamine reductase [Clostridium oryzae]
MNIEKLAARLETILDKKNIKINEPMSKHTTFRVGGNAKVLVLPSSIKEMMSVIELLKQENIDYIVIGNGSNLIVSDEGYDGVIIKTSKLNSIKVYGNIIEADCGAFISSISKIALENHLSGIECLSGIPGTIGGAVTMNAGAYNVEIKDVIYYTYVLNESGKIVKMTKDDLMLSYRKSILQNSNNILLSAALMLKPDCHEAIHSKMIEIQSKRVSTQPLNYPNAGSIFKRISGQPVGAIIENAGLKNTAIGGAKVSEKHANFIINTGNATAADIINLIKFVKKTVKNKANIDLETEVKIIY